ncbi:MAG: sporulation protein YqfD [Firmicutes bacterium]|nr:sporulation protein YqfD [Bacillota bacterium]
MKGYLVRILGGWRQVRLRGQQLERLVEYFLDDGFEMWQLTRDREGFSAQVTERGYQALVARAADLGIDVVTVRAGGLPMRWREVRRRPFLLAGLLTWWLMVSYAMSHVWVVNVDAPGLSSSEAQALVSAARRAGLTVGVLRNHLDIPQVRRRMLNQLPQFSWIGVRLKGMVAMIEAVPLVVRPPDHLPSRLVASKSGRVTAVDVYMGASEVAPGEFVKAGQTLIQGVIIAKPPGAGDETGEAPEAHVLTPAEGQVMADVTYRVSVAQPLVQREEERTGRIFIRHFVVFDQNAIWPVPTLSAVPFRAYAEEKIREPLRFAGVDLPIELISVVYNEIVAKSVQLTPRQARMLAEARALEEMRRMVPRDATRVRQSVTVESGKQGVRATMVWVMNENIAKPPPGQSGS